MPRLCIQALRFFCARNFLVEIFITTVEDKLSASFGSTRITVVLTNFVRSLGQLTLRPSEHDGEQLVTFRVFFPIRIVIRQPEEQIAFRKSSNVKSNTFRDLLTNRETVQALVNTRNVVPTACRLVTQQSRYKIVKHPVFPDCNWWLFQRFQTIQGYCKTVFLQRPGNFVIRTWFPDPS